MRLAVVGSLEAEEGNVDLGTLLWENKKAELGVVRFIRDGEIAWNGRRSFIPSDALQFLIRGRPCGCSDMMGRSLYAEVRPRQNSRRVKAVRLSLKSLM